VTIEQTLAEYANENCDWNDTEYLIKCAERYGQVSEPSHLHCLAVALANKLQSLDQAKAICEANGLAVVPVEPTKAMLKYVCNCECFINLDSSQAILDDYYKAMLEAAKDSP